MISSWWVPAVSNSDLPLFVGSAVSLKTYPEPQTMCLSVPGLLLWAFCSDNRHPKASSLTWPTQMSQLMSGDTQAGSGPACYSPSGRYTPSRLPGVPPAPTWLPGLQGGLAPEGRPRVGERP